jgi:penicillin-binding protein 1C
VAWRPTLARLAATLALLLPSAAWATAPSFPTYSAVKAHWRSSEASLLDRHGQRLQEIRVDFQQRRTDWTPLAEISPALISAVLLAEDRRFFQHAGVDWLAAGKAALSNWLSERPRGASTVTMQLAAMLDPDYRAGGGRRNVSEKWDQMQAARELDRTWRKTEILEAYLNLAAFRGELNGIDAAARGLFDKRPAGLSAAESLLLAVLIRAPNARPATAGERACALAQDLPGAPACAALKTLARNTLTGRYPIVPSARLAPHLARRLIDRQADVTSSLDAGLQRQVMGILEEQLRYLASREVQDAAALVLDNARGEVLAYVSASGRDSISPESDGVRALRQAGSTLKPFLYGLALEQGLLTAASPLEDTPLSITTAAGQYAPQNYDHSHRGLASVRYALGGSLNIPAVRTLQLVGPETFAARLAKNGFSLSENADFYGYSLALGSLDVSLEQLTNAYRSLANGGLHSPLRYTAATRPPSGRRVHSRETAWLIADILADREARAATFGLESPLATRFWTAVKTGTSKDLRDNWCIGFSSRYTVGVWVGNFSGAPMHDVSGSSGAAPAWAAIMQILHADTPSTPPPPPPGLIRRRIQPPGEAPRREWFLPGSEPLGSTWAVATPPARIVDPGHGAILALDPDLPADRQVLVFRADSAPDRAVWHLDDVHLDTPAWRLQRGKHRLELRDRESRLLDQVNFEVR